MRERRQNNKGRGRSRNNRGNNNRGRGGGGRGRRSERYNSGNQRERISVESGFVVLIDQYMLANQQFTEKLDTLMDAEPEKKDSLVQEFGGSVVKLAPGQYRIDRDPYRMKIVVHPEGESAKKISVDINEESRKQEPRVAIDTRCIVMIDRELLDDYSLIEKYQSLWVNDQNKACRDLLRDNGGAVRYGFSKEADELQVSYVEEHNSIVLTPRPLESARPEEQA